MTLPTPVRLHELATAEWGPGYLLWEPETIRHEAARASGALRGRRSADALLAVAALKRTDLPWTEMECFESVAHALNFVPPDFTEVEGIDLDELYFALACMQQLREDPVPIFTDEVSRYCAVAHLNGGLFAAVPPAAFCNDILREYRPDLYHATTAAMRGEQGPAWAIWGARAAEAMLGSLHTAGLGAPQ